MLRWIAIPHGSPARAVVGQCRAHHVAYPADSREHVAATMVIWSLVVLLCSRAGARKLDPSTPHRPAVIVGSLPKPQLTLRLYLPSNAVGAHRSAMSQQPDEMKTSHTRGATDQIARRIIGRSNSRPIDLDVSNLTRVADTARSIRAHRVAVDSRRPAARARCLQHNLTCLPTKSSNSKERAWARTASTRPGSNLGHLPINRPLASDGKTVTLDYSRRFLNRPYCADNIYFVFILVFLHKHHMKNIIIRDMMVW